MNPKLRDYVAMAAMMAMLSGGGVNRSQSSVIVKETPNRLQKCFRKGCEKTRSGNKLYCSAECNKLDKQERKKRNAH